MNKTKQYLIPFRLKLGKHHFEYQISNFEIFDYDEFKFRYQSKCSFREKGTMLELIFKQKGIGKRSL
jgi:hypothetical protein